jgi:G:T-mismatch repair DNA endonuclease (very short patch repair protein)
MERELADFCRKFGNIEEQTRQIIPPLELDVYFPEKRIAVELHGVYWHSEEYKKDPQAHKRKMEFCKEKNVRLIQVFEDEWRDQKRIVQSRLKHILGHTPRMIYARQCEVRPLSSALSNKFLNKYHIQGGCNSPIRYGLFRKNRLVAVMTFAPSRKALGGKNNEMELVRYCSLFNWTVMGGAGKMLKHFINQHNPKNIISFADCRWSDGALYFSLGFTLEKTCKVGYSYVADNKRINRIQFQKHKLQKKLPIFDPSLSESDNMRANGYYRIWDAGQLKFTLNNLRD